MLQRGVLRVLIAPDKFKGTLNASEAATTIRSGIAEAAAEYGLQLETMLLPLADGGEGSHEVLHTLDPELSERSAAYPGPDGGRHTIRWLESSEPPCAFLETALLLGADSGRRLPPLARRSSFGVGLWLKDRIASGMSLCYLMLGGSLTSDGGLGMARALGFQLFDDRHQPLSELPQLERLRDIQLPSAPGAQIIALSDVRSPLLGDRGAALRFGKQKGATAAELQAIEAWLARFENLLSSITPASGALPGAGAAGGLCFPLTAWPRQFRFASGIDFFLERSGFDRCVAAFRPHWMVSGEGRVDLASLDGKVPGGAAQRLRQLGSKAAVMLIAGQAPDRESLQSAAQQAQLPLRIFDTVSCCGPGVDDEWRRKAAQRLQRTAREAALKVLAEGPPSDQLKNDER
ncbi:MAG: glycerate kinase [Leptospirales bacterium]|nr:glycerate kinase [Leptospirales bacterium]